MLLIAAITASLPATTFAGAPPTEHPEGYGIFEPVTIDPPAPRPATPPSTPVAEAAPTREPASAPTEPAPAPAEPEQQISPLVPKSQFEFLEGHPVDLERVEFRPGKGLTISSKSKRFELTTGLRAQFLYTLAHDNEPDADAAVQHSFQIRRARLTFSGHMFGAHNKYKVELALSPRDVGLADGVASNTVLLDYYLDFDHLRDLTLRVGQYKINYSVQRVISSGRLQLVDRSLNGPEFDLDRDIGLDLRSEDFLGVGRMRYYAGVYFGGGRDNYTPEPVTHGGGLMYLARFEVLPFGLFDDYIEGDFDRTKQPRLALGGAYAYIDDAIFNRGDKGQVPTDGGTTDYHNATASLVLKIVGFSLISEFFWRRGVRHPGDAQIEDDMGNLVPAPIEAPRNGLGWYTQAGYMIPHAPVELAARYSQVRAIGTDTQTSMSDRDELGGGLSWYVAGHPYKLQADYFRIWDESIGRGLDQFRVQFQLSF